jgi:hypothetical protein
MDLLELEKYWNNKHPQQKVIYSGRYVINNGNKVNINIDVRNLIAENDSTLLDIIENNNLKADTHDETMWRIQKWVVANLRYVGDDVNSGVPEFWQFPFESVALGIGDCEDFAILIASLAINADIPSFRVRVVAGWVKPHEITAPEGGHGYVAYLRESEDWVAIDGCFYEDSSIATKDKPILKENPLYKEVWFSFNHLSSYANKEFELSGRVNKKTD